MKSYIKTVSNHYKHFFTRCMVGILLFLMIGLNPILQLEAKASIGKLTTYPFVLLTNYEKTLAIGDSFYLVAFTSNGKSPTYKSSNGKVASVNTYGKILAKKAGTAIITVKIKGAEATCLITVDKTKITLNESTISLEHGETFQLKTSTSTGSMPIYKTNRKSIAAVDETGLITAKKPGEATITISADGTKVTCKVRVKKPKITLNETKISLYRGETFQLKASISSNLLPKWKTNRKSIAIVDDSGLITAKKHGNATITATLDGVAKTCEVTVLSPTITLSSNSLTLQVGQTTTLYATVSSGNTPTWSCSNNTVIDLTSDGTITAKKKGTAYVYVKEDGTKVKCKIIVIDKEN
ncbi:Ig-like domain-containing protein [Anaerosporobacter faecicola]|uniref:Ig-like domain-containing protein n=1 Tax=Anaerosporobacter faecicola TaxID=2718714 RepID=UPI0014398C3F|nr:Ig-like domain-containing protein [Anaerosporobacter faecicola]